MTASRRRFLAQVPLAPLALPAAAQPRPSGPKTLRVAFPTAETGFDPAQVQDLYSRTVLAHILDAPLEYDGPAQPARLRPNTAAALPEVSPDHRTFTIRLRPGIFFADDPAFKGRKRELTAHDYVYSFKRLYDPRWKSPMLFVLDNSKLLGLNELRQQALRTKTPFDYDREVEGLRALDRYTLQIKLAEPDPRFVYNLADASTLGAVAREVVDAYGDEIMAHPVGTGPFRLAHWTRSSRIVLERNPDFRQERYDFDPAADMRDEVARLRGRRLPLVDRVEISIIEEDQPRWLAFLQGEVDLLAVPGEFIPIAAPNGKLAPFLERRGVRLQRSAAADIVLTYFNMDSPVVGGYTPDKIALRRAIALAIDGDEYIRHMYAGMGLRAQSPFVPGTFGYDPGYASEMGEFSRPRAAALLDMFGYVDRNGDGWREMPDGSPLVLELASSPSQTDRKRDELWQRYMTAVGLRIQFRVAQWAELLRMSLAGKLMMWSYGWQVGSPDSDTLFAMGYGPNKEQLNDARFDLPEYNALYQRQRVLADGPERLQILHRAARLLIAYMPYKFHAHRVAIDLVQPWIDGYRRHPFSTRQWHRIDVDAQRRAAGR